MLVPSQQPSWLRDARAMPVIEWGVVQLRSLVPSETKDASVDAANDARDRTREVLGTERLLRDIMTPEPKGPSTDAERGGYDEKERREMERLLESDR